MDQLLTIGKLSKQVGIPAKTIRFYEEIGLIAKVRRAQNGYRLYHKRVIEELSIIKYARDLGLPIQEIKKLIHGCEDGTCDHTKEYLQKEVGVYIAKLDEKIEQLLILRNQLINLKSHLVLEENNCKKDSFCCNILRQIESFQKGGGK